MNVHHLELFYYVAKHRGISAAVRKIPYGIQQPAVSGQMGRLEEELGVRLFTRQPFRLTKEGEILNAHVAPFFDALAAVATEVRAAGEPELRIAGAELVLRDHLPGVMRQVKQSFPKMRLSLRSTGYGAEVEQWLREGLVDVAFVPVYPKVPKGLRQTRFARLPVVLQVHPQSPWRSASELWAQKKISEPLLALPETTNFTRNFLSELKRRGITWRSVVEATSLDLVSRYVANGDGIGLTVQIDPKARPRGVRVLPLPDFPPMTMGALWRGRPSPQVQAMIGGVREYAKATWPEWACAE
jgi:DNA-binding transcriptional LysR family regulator